jgi:hypothetical protein
MLSELTMYESSKKGTGWFSVAMMTRPSWKGEAVERSVQLPCRYLRGRVRRERHGHEEQAHALLVDGVDAAVSVDLRVAVGHGLAETAPRLEFRAVVSAGEHERVAGVRVLVEAAHES